ncbi:hypothetical protein HAX54_045897 [Datura stramonium]|uniref:Uncharacterized protein n=1 Tax=Datura stramonium TaxID=4076 RepID=A0ABS8SSH3_DATST|nr:hypothetical protein [Datura stramonium]
MTSDRTKVVHFQPHSLFINRVGCSVCLRQIDSQSVEWIHPTDPPKHFSWRSSKVELLKGRKTAIVFPIRFRQVDGAYDSWKFLPPNASASFSWEDLGRRRLLEQTLSNSESEFHVIVEVAELGLSVIDHTPEEILYLSVQSLCSLHSTQGLGSGVSRLMTALGNTENMTVRINQRFGVENACMRHSVMIGSAIANIKKDLLSQPLQLLSGLDTG